MKVLCICQKGNSRSVALAWLLKQKYKMDAIAIGIRTCSQETKNLLYEWADAIILTDKKYTREIPERYTEKLKVWHVGTDIWFKGYDKGLVEMYRAYMRDDDFV